MTARGKRCSLWLIRRFLANAFSRRWTLHIELGKPNQNAFVESFNGRVRDECLNQHWFLSLAEARRTVAAYQLLYYTGRRHGALGTMTPSEYADTFTPSTSSTSSPALA